MKTRRTRLLTRALVCGAALAVLSLGGLWAYAGVYGLHVLFRHGGTWWIPVAADSARLSPAMRLALDTAPTAAPGPFQWQKISEGFETADLPAMVDGRAVDHLLLARIDPHRFRFTVRSAPAGDTGLDQWMVQLGAALVVNGSYSAIDGHPATPIISDGTPLGPNDYAAQAGVFTTSPAATAVQDLNHTDWQSALQGADDAMVSFPLLVADGATRVPYASRWLANRSFVGQDSDGLIVIGTTTDAFFTLDRLAHFLLGAPLGLTRALNLDGGPVASQAIALNGYERRSYGRWEAQVDGDHVKLLTWPYGSIALPVVLAVYPK